MNFPIGDILQGGILVTLAFLIVWERLRKPPEEKEFKAKIEKLDRSLEEIKTALAEKTERLGEIRRLLDEVRRAIEEAARLAKDSQDLHNVFIPGTKTPVWYENQNLHDAVLTMKEQIIPEQTKLFERIIPETENRLREKLLDIVQVLKEIVTKINEVNTKIDRSNWGRSNTDVRRT